MFCHGAHTITAPSWFPLHFPPFPHIISDHHHSASTTSVTASISRGIFLSLLLYRWVTGPIVVIELDAIIREIPCGSNSKYSTDKGCLAGTRVAFLDFIMNWVNNPDSERGLVLFGQAGTGKSSIAHEIARQFDKMKHPISLFAGRNNPNALRITCLRLSLVISPTAILRSKSRSGMSSRITRLFESALVTILPCSKSSSWNRLRTCPSSVPSFS